MSNPTAQINQEFSRLIGEIPHIGFKKHATDLIQHAELNSAFIKKSIKALPALQGAKAKSCIIISAGPSVKRQNSIKRVLNANYQGTIISADGAYTACLKEGLIPDFVLTLDPHTKRVVRWFGDPHFEKNSANDDYFTRQDLDVDFRKNSIEHNKQNIELVNKHAPKTKVLVCTTAPMNVVQRLLEAKFDMYWWNPLVDKPNQLDSLTRKLHDINKLPCLNTGGNVGTAAWVFANTFFKIPSIGMVGMDYGYYHDTPFKQTQTYFELASHLGTEEGIEKYFIQSTFPLTGEKFYTDATYFWYRQNFIDLLKMAYESKTYNCTEGGTLVDDTITCMNLDEFLKKHG